MARGRSGRSSATTVPVATVPGTNTPDPLATVLQPSAPSLPDPDPLPRPLSLVEDNRLWHPADELRPVLEIDGRRARIGVGRTSYNVYRRSPVAWANTQFSAKAYPVGFQVPVGTSWESPFRVAVCVRRKVRRMIMFAKKKVGKGAKQKRRRRNHNSGVSC